MEEQLCLTMIRNKYSSLTKAEQKIANYVLANSAQVVNLSVASLASMVGVGGSAVIRFCRSLGFETFAQLKIRLAVDISHPETFVGTPVTPGDDPTAVCRKVFGASIHTLNDTLRMMNGDILCKAVDRLRKATRVCFFGVGTSSILAVDAQYRLMQLGYSAQCSTDILFMSVMAMNMRAGEVAFAISHSGRTTATLETLRTAREHGAYTIALTSYLDSPISRYADLVLPVFPDDRNYPSEAVSARIAHLCVLDSLMISLSLFDYENTCRRIAARNQALRKIRE